MSSSQPPRRWRSRQMWHPSARCWVPVRRANGRHLGTTGTSEGHDGGTKTLFFPGKMWKTFVFFWFFSYFSQETCGNMVFFFDFFHIFPRKNVEIWCFFRFFSYFSQEKCGNMVFFFNKETMRTWFKLRVRPPGDIMAVEHKHWTTFLVLPINNETSWRKNKQPWNNVDGHEKKRNFIARRCPRKNRMQLELKNGGSWITTENSGWDPLTTLMIFWWFTGLGSAHNNPCY